ncbi:hypothetical protein [Spirosoma montaniterrae]|uniref:Uncharacterized protein n=1 Tax=Spirosoma montaniterrae TaxID=1178516 RepID=A0A1P9WTL3_9BACT|nr:hypothetical protein [Spirosoma montaniterrae]AQG78721.1 hypothetical protein AWR27_04855 [Spirosoma montaniterrae]
MRYVLYLLLLLTACHRAEVAPATELRNILWGRWIESSARRDTLIFRQSNSIPASTRLEGYVTVNRGRADNGYGQITPRLGSGIYQFYVEGNKIYVYNMLSSMFQFAPYTFLYNDPGKGLASSLTPALSVGNFFELNVRVPETGVKTFVQLP